MIIEKNISKKEEQVSMPPVISDVPRVITTVEEAYTVNALTEVYKAVRDIISKIPQYPDDPDSPPMFRTIKLNSGQMNRIKNNKWNKEYALAFPAVFINFINVRYLVSQSRIGDGRAELRIEIVLNNLNNEDDEVECEGFRAFQLINSALQKSYRQYTALTERLQLTYFDQPELMDDGVQIFWITYDVWFKEYSAYAYKDYVDCYIVIPPFTNHSDQDPTLNIEHHDDHKEVSYEDASTLKIVPELPYERIVAESFVFCKKAGGGNIGQNMSPYTSTFGWKGSNIYEDIMGVRIGTGSSIGSLITPDLKINDIHDKITIVFTAKPYRNDTDIAINISYDDQVQTIHLEDNESTHFILFDVVNKDVKNAVIETTIPGHRAIITGVDVYSGDASVVQYSL